MPKGFISYSSQDAGFVSQLEASLKRAQFDTWRDVQSLRAGERWPRKLGDAIAASPTFILIWSANADRSDFVELEWTIAIALKRTICIIALDASDLPTTLRSTEAKRTTDAGEASRWLLNQEPSAAPPTIDTTANPTIQKLSATTDTTPPREITINLSVASFAQAATAVHGNVIQSSGPVTIIQSYAEPSAPPGTATVLPVATASNSQQRSFVPSSSWERVNPAVTSRVLIQAATIAVVAIAVRIAARYPVILSSVGLALSKPEASDALDHSVWCALGSVFASVLVWTELMDTQFVLSLARVLLFVAVLGLLCSIVSCMPGVSPWTHGLIFTLFIAAGSIYYFVSGMAKYYWSIRKYGDVAAEFLIFILFVYIVRRPLLMLLGI